MHFRRLDGLEKDRIKCFSKSNWKGCRVMIYFEKLFSVRIQSRAVEQSVDRFLDLKSVSKMLIYNVLYIYILYLILR